MKLHLVTSLALLPTALTAQITLEKNVINKLDSFLQSYKGIELPAGMVVQGSEVHFTAKLDASSKLDAKTTKFSYSFKQKRGDVKFLGSAGAAKNHFKADWYGENIITVTATDASGKIEKAEVRVVCEFASRRVVGGDAENLPEDYKKSIRRSDIHDIRKEKKGMAYLPKDISRGDVSSKQMTMGFFETTEPRLFKTSKGTLLTSTQARRIGRSDAPEGQAIIMKRSTDHGATWIDEQMLDQHGNDVWGYTAMVEVDGTIYCYVAAGHPTHQNSNKTLRGLYYYTSTDDGKTWSTRKRHDQISKAMDFNIGEKIPRGTSPNCNILVVPGLTIDGKEAPSGQGLLFSTYAHGYMWASINGGMDWVMVGDCKELIKDKVEINNELAWSVLDNKDGDVYMIWRRQAFTGYKLEYVLSKHFKTGRNGMTLKRVYNQDLKNVLARRCHFGLRTIAHGSDRGKVILATQGAGSRNHIVLGVSKEAITSGEIPTKLYDKVTVMQGIAWGYCDLEHLSTTEPGYKSLGKDAIMLFGESEPVHKETHQYIPLSPNGKGKDERYSATVFMLSMDYFKFLQTNKPKKVVAQIPAGVMSFEESQGWADYKLAKTPHQTKQISDVMGNVWQPHYYYNREEGVARTGTGCLALGIDGREWNYLTFAPKDSSIQQLVFYIQRYSGRKCTLELKVEHRTGDGGWATVFAKTYQPNEAVKYTKVAVDLNISAKSEIRIGVKGEKGFLIDDLKTSAK